MNENNDPVAPKPEEPKPEEPVVTQPDQPAAAPAQNTPAVPNKTKSSKFIALVVGGALLVVLAILAVIFFVHQNNVNREDYQAASDQYNAVRRSGADVSRAISAMSSRISSSNDETFEEAVRDVDTALGELAAETDKLGELKAMQKGEGAEKFTAFDEKLNGYMEHAKIIVTSVQDLRPALLKCTDASRGADNDARATQIEACSRDVQRVSEKIGNEQLKTFTVTLGEQYGELADVYKDANAQAAAGGSNAAQARELRAKLGEIQTDIVSATTKLSRDIRTEDNNVGPEDEANALSDFLKAKLNESNS